MIHDLHNCWMRVLSVCNRWHCMACRSSSTGVDHVMLTADSKSSKGDKNVNFQFQLVAERWVVFYVQILLTNHINKMRKSPVMRGASTVVTQSPELECKFGNKMNMYSFYPPVDRIIKFKIAFELIAFVRRRWRHQCNIKIERHRCEWERFVWIAHIK